MSKSKSEDNLPFLIQDLYTVYRELREKKIDRADAKAVNQTSNQIMSGYKIQLGALKLLGNKAPVTAYKALLG